MLEIINSIEELVEKSMEILSSELDRVENDRKFDEYEATIESVYCKLCDIKLELKIGTTKLSNSDENEIDKMIDMLLNGGEIIEKINLLSN